MSWGLVFDFLNTYKNADASNKILSLKTVIFRVQIVETKQMTPLFSSTLQAESEYHVRIQIFGHRNLTWWLYLGPLGLNLTHSILFDHANMEISNLHKIWKLLMYNMSSNLSLSPIWPPAHGLIRRCVSIGILNFSWARISECLFVCLSAFLGQPRELKNWLTELKFGTRVPEVNVNKGYFHFF